MSELRLHLDLLQRFVATPYVFREENGVGPLHVQSNDLEIALSIRRSGAVLREAERTGGLLVRLIRDRDAPTDHSEILILSDGSLRTLYMGRGTILVHDQEKSELLGFVSRNVNSWKVSALLIPALINLK